MKLHVPGDKSRAMCGDCGPVETTFRYRDVPFRDGSGTVRDILVGVCDKCGMVATIPPQSTPAIRAERQRATVSVEAVLPAVFLDALDLACYRIDPQSSPDFRKRLISSFVHMSARNSGMAARLADCLRHAPPVFASAPDVTKRLSYKITEAANREIEAVMEATSLNRTDLLKSVVVAISDDIVWPEKPKGLDRLRMLAAAG